MKLHIPTDSTMRYFWCPGCDHVHGILALQGEGWECNDDPEHPTIQPSVLVQRINTLDPDGKKIRTPLCHSFVTDGRIQFLSDSTHHLAGQTVDLPDYPEEHLV